jgi:hypothetical protein
MVRHFNDCDVLCISSSIYYFLIADPASGGGEFLCRHVWIWRLELEDVKEKNI